MDSELLELTTGGRLTTDITSAAADFCRGRGDGLLQVFVPHATAGVAIFETGAGSEEDLALTLESLLPRDAAYLHRHGSPGHGRDHVLPALVAPSSTWRTRALGPARVGDVLARVLPKPEGGT